MHIPDGILSGEVCAATGAIAAAAVGVSTYKLRHDLSDRVVPLTGMMAAMIFAGQMVNFPLAGVPVSGHLVGGVLAAVMLGPWAGCLAITMVLIVQRFLFADGGMLSLGANVLHMAVIGSMGGWAIVSLVRRFFRGPAGTIVGAVIASWLTVVAASALFCVEFWWSHRGGEFDFRNIFSMMVGLHALIGIGEALITGVVVGYVLQVRPDLVRANHSADTIPASIGAWTAAGLVVALAIGAFLAPWASSYPDGLEAVAEQKGFDSLATSAWSLFADYDKLIQRAGWETISVSLAGVVGALSVFAMAIVLGRAVAARTES